MSYQFKGHLTFFSLDYLVFLRLGTETDFFAGNRACRCLKEFYRTHMFEECHKCASQGGLQCKDDYASLKPGYWWKWRNQTYKHRYIYFIKNLLASPPLLDDFSVQYPYPIPTPYKCPVEKSCGWFRFSMPEWVRRSPLCSL